MAVLSCGKDDPTSSSVQGLGSGATISGTVQQSGNCSQNPVTVTLYNGQSAVGTQSVNVGSSFSFSVNPGSYTVGAQNSSGCGAQQPVSVSQGQTGQATLTLVQGGQYTPTGTGGIYTGGTGTGAALSGVVSGSGACTQNPVTISVYNGNSVVQQSSVNIGASFNLQVSPGSYTVHAQNTSGCGASQSVYAYQGQTASVNLTLVQGGGTGTYGGGTYGGGYYGGGYYGGGYYGGGVYGSYGTYPYYPYGYNPFVTVPRWSPGVTYPYVYMYGPYGTGYYYWNQGSYAGPCTYGAAGGWLCRNTF